MAKLVNVSLVLALFVVCASVFTEGGARDIGNNENSPAEAPYVDPLLRNCRISGPCAESLAQLIVTKAVPSKKDVVCCKEIVQTTKYCWETVMNLIEDPNIPVFTNLHPWAENAWDKCVSLTESPAQAPMLSDNSPMQAPSLPAQCQISETCANNLAQILVAKELPHMKDYGCCREIVQNTKDCWDKTIKIVEDPNIPALAHLHPWADKFWNSCVILTTKFHSVGQ